MVYPESPGHKAGGTSSAAGRHIEQRAKTLRDRVYTFLQANYPASFTADEVAERLGASILSVRPRVTELLRANLIEPAEERRQNKSGMLAQCWRVKVIR